MAPKFTLYFISITCSFLLVISPMMGQTPDVKKKCSASNKQITATAVTKSIAPQRVKINLPPDYKPPTADEKLINFPETTAGKVKQKRLLKKRKKGKKKGCVAANM